MNQSQPRPIETKSQPRPINSTALFALLIIGGSIAVVLISAIAGEQLGDVVGAIAVFGAIFVATLAIVAIIIRLAADPVAKIQTTLLDGQREANRHVEKMASLGLQRPKWGYEPLQLPTITIEPDIPIAFPGGATETAVAPYNHEALEVVALSKQIMGERAEQIIPYAKAKENDYFRGKAGYEHWNNGCQWLSIHQYVEPRKQGQRHLGTFCIHDIGTVGRLYDKLHQR